MGSSLPFQKPAVNERSRYFGSPLAKVVESDGVPVFVHKCVQFIETNGIQMVGLYRVSGKKDDCLALQEKYDQGWFGSELPLIWLSTFSLPGNNY